MISRSTSCSPAAGHTPGWTVTLMLDRGDGKGSVPFKEEMTEAKRERAIIGSLDRFVVAADGDEREEEGEEIFAQDARGIRNADMDVWGLIHAALVEATSNEVCALSECFAEQGMSR